MEIFIHIEPTTRIRYSALLSQYYIQSYYFILTRIYNVQNNLIVFLSGAKRFAWNYQLKKKYNGVELFTKNIYFFKKWFTHLILRAYV